MALLDWEAQAGDIRWSIEEGRKKKRPPTADQLAMLAREPEVDTGTRILARAYAELASCRQVGMGMGPIPWTAMIAWSRHHRLDRDVTDHMINVVRRVDNVYLRRAAAEAKAPPSRNGAR